MGSRVEGMMDREEGEVLVEKVEEMKVKRMKSEGVENMEDGGGGGKEVGYGVMMGGG